MSEALKRIERAMDRLARATPLNSQVLQPIERELEMGLALAREEWRRLKTVETRLARLMENAQDALEMLLGSKLGAGSVRLSDALREARYSEDIGYGDTLDDDIKARTR